MLEFWLDSNVFIEGKKGPYAFDIAPRFWALIDELINDGQIACPQLVYDELLEVQDDLAGWAKKRRTSGLFIQPDAAVQDAYRDVVDYVGRKYPDNQARRRFLNRADPWVIAHAISESGAVVTLEPRVAPSSKQAKIPNVCDHFSIWWLNTYQLLRELGISWDR